jgi:dipeptidyl-peptidase 4
MKNKLHRILLLLLVHFILCKTGTDATLAQQRPATNLEGTVSNVAWDVEGKFVDFTNAGKRYRFDLKKLEKTELSSEKVEDEQNAGPRQRPQAGGGFRRGGTSGPPAASTGRYLDRPERGRQHTRVESPDQKWEAQYRDWNLVLVNLENKEEIQVTSDGNEHIHYGTASWVYGEELRQTQAIWWTPDSKKVLFYKFDDTHVKPFYLLRGLSEINTEIYPEYYPKAGETNPTAELYVYDLAFSEIKQIKIGGNPDEYIYGIRTTPKGDRMLVNWTDRLQQHLKVMSIDLESGECTPIIEERQSTWQTNSPPMTFLNDQFRFLWPTDTSGYTHYELRDLDSKYYSTITKGDFQISSIELMEEDGLLGFVANSSPVNPYFSQYHLVELDGSNPRRVTTLDHHHSNFQLSTDRNWLIAQYEDVNLPPTTVIYRTDGSVVAEIAKTESVSPANLAEPFSFTASDGKTEIFGVLYKPADFDPTKKYPVINTLYGGPGSIECRYNYVSTPHAYCQRGYLVVRVNNRGTGGRGKGFLTSTYQKLGDLDIQDHADAIRHLSSRPYFDSTRVGIVGHSYGGYMAAMGIFKHPDVYAAAVIRAGVTDWRNYDTIYTERYMSTPQLNPEGYKAGSAMTHVNNLKGKVLIMHGMLDDNVHPNNAFQLIEALDRQNKPYESRFWPNAGHGLGRGAGDTEVEFFNRVLQTAS